MSKSIHVKNYKGVREITLHPTGALVVIAGANGAGKSSLIDAITELFDPKGTRLTPKPIHDGEDEARAEYVDTDLDVRIVRTWKKNDAGKLEVFALDGAKYSKPAEVVAQLTGGLIFDPVAFLNLDEKRQRDALLAKVDLPIDLDEVAREKAGAESRRLEAGREVRRLQGALSSLPAPTPGQPTEEVSAADVLTDLQEAQQHNTDIQRHGDVAIELGRRIAVIDREIARVEDQLAELTAERTQTQKRADAEQALAVAEQPIDIAPIQARLAAVDETNKAVRSAKEYTRTAAELAAATGAVAEAQLDLDAIDGRKREALAAAKFPVDGLSVDEDGITFDGIPFGQVNTATRLRVAFAIATAGNPKLKLVIVRTGDLLDSTSLAAVADIAEGRGYTVLMERDRDESRDIGFTIIAGALAETGVAK